METARKIAGQLDEDRDDFGTEFGPTNVAIHAVNIAVELGDAGQAIELGQQVTAASLSPERQARYWLDLAQAHNMRRARSVKPSTPSKKPSASPRRKPASTTPDEPSPETCSSSPDYAPGQNYAMPQARTTRSRRAVRSTTLTGSRSLC